MNMGHQQRRWFRRLGFAAALAVIVTVGLVIGSRDQPTPEELPQPSQEISREQLVLREGRLVDPTSGSPFTGIVVDHYDGRELRSRSAISNGLMEGLSEGWYANGQKQVTEHFQSGVSNGLRTKWFPSGAMKSESMIIDGKLNGLYQQWHENGVLSAEIQMTDGKPAGVSFAYYPSGSQKSRVAFSNGKIIEQQSWPDGRFEQ